LSVGGTAIVAQIGLSVHVVDKAPSGHPIHAVVGEAAIPEIIRVSVHLTELSIARRVRIIVHEVQIVGARFPEYVSWERHSIGRTSG